MMIKLKSKIEKIEEIISKTCDVCGKTYTSDDYIEFDCFVHINERCGYGSIFGDGSYLNLDICQCCVSSVLGAYIRVEEDHGKVLEDIEDGLIVYDDIICYVDGACSGNPGPAGIGIVVCCDDIKKEIFENIGNATNNIAELYAIKKCLESIAVKDRVIKIYTDSQYAIGTLTMNWTIKANRDLIYSIRDLMSKFKKIEFIKVAGHTGDVNNERANILAQKASKGII